MCRITWGVIWIFLNGHRKFCMKSSIELFTIILSFFEKKTYFSEFTFLKYRCLLPLSATVQMDNEENMLVTQRMMTLIYEPKIKSSCVVI